MKMNKKMVVKSNKVVMKSKKVIMNVNKMVMKLNKTVKVLKKVEKITKNCDQHLYIRSGQQWTHNEITILLGHVFSQRIDRQELYDLDQLVQSHQNGNQ